MMLIDPNILLGLNNINKLKYGPQKSFMSLSFSPKSVNELHEKPNARIKTKDQDFALGTEIHYKFAPDNLFNSDKTKEGTFILSILAAECKINLDKTMYQEAAGTAERLKQGVPVAKYFLITEYLDMTPEDNRLTAIDQVFILRKTRRLPYGKRNDLSEMKRKHEEYPISDEVILLFVKELQTFIDSTLYNPDIAFERGTFSPPL